MWLFDFSSGPLQGWMSIVLFRAKGFRKRCLLLHIIASTTAGDIEIPRNHRCFVSKGTH